MNKSTDVNDTLNKICSVSNGDTLFFTSYYSVLSPNLLEDLLEQNTKDKIVIANEVNIDTSKEYGYIELHGLLGKLFKKELFIDAFSNAENVFFEDCEIWNVYKENFKDVELSETAYCYYSLCDEITLSKKEYNETKFVNTLMILNKLDDKNRDSLEEALVNRVDYANSLDIACDDICQYAGDSYYLMMNIVVNYYKSLYSNFCKKLNREEYEQVKSFLVRLDGAEELQELALGELNISKEMFSAMRRLDYRNYRYVVQDSNYYRATVCPEGIYNLSGLDLANFVISKYSQGRLGAGTILKSVGAWARNKIKR